MKTRRGNNRTILDNHNGVSLMELMIAVGISSILALGSAMLITNVFQSNKMTEKRMDEISITRHMADLLQEEATCTKTLKNKIVPDNAEVEQTLADGIIDSDNRRYYMVDGKKVGGGKIEIARYFLDTTDPWVGINTASGSNIGTVDFVVEYDRGEMAAQKGEVSRYKRNLRLIVELDDSTPAILSQRIIKRCKIGDVYDQGHWFHDPATDTINYNQVNIGGGQAKVLIGISKVKTAPPAAVNAIFTIDNTYLEKTLGMWTVNLNPLATFSNTASTPAATIGQTLRVTATLKIPIRNDLCAGCPRGALWIIP